MKQLADGSYTTLLANDIPAGHRSRVTLLSATQALVEDMPPAGSSIYTTGGTSTAYTIAPAPAISAYTAGQSFMVNFNAASGNNPTLQISGIATPPNLVKLKGDGTYGNIKANELPSGLRARVTLISATQAVVDGYPFVKPAFSAYAGATQSPTSGADTKVQCNSEIYDTAGAYDPATYRFTAPVPGFYEFTGILQGGGTSCTSYIALLFKNGAIARGGDRFDYCCQLRSADGYGDRHPPARCW